MFNTNDHLDVMHCFSRMLAVSQKIPDKSCEKTVNYEIT